MTLVPIYTLDFGLVDGPDGPSAGNQKAPLMEIFDQLQPTDNGLSRNGLVDGFAITSEASRCLLRESGLTRRLREIFAIFNPDNAPQVAERGHAARVAVLETPVPARLQEAILQAYGQLCSRLGHEPEMSVRPSSIPEDLPEHSIASSAETYFPVRGREGLLQAVKQCWASLFSDRAISYRARFGFDQTQARISVGIATIERSNETCADTKPTAEANAAGSGDRGC
jgi:pyruvate,water dikinase